MTRIKGIYHLIIAIAFLSGTFLIDLDHRPFNIKEMVTSMFYRCGGDTGRTCIMQRGVLHNKFTFYFLAALTAGVYIHLKMDGIL